MCVTPAWIRPITPTPNLISLVMVSAVMTILMLNHTSTITATAFLRNGCAARAAGIDTQQSQLPSDFVATRKVVRSYQDDDQLAAGAHKTDPFLTVDQRRQVLKSMVPRACSPVREWAQRQRVFGSYRLATRFMSGSTCRISFRSRSNLCPGIFCHQSSGRLLTYVAIVLRTCASQFRWQSGTAPCHATQPHAVSGALLDGR